MMQERQIESCIDKDALTPTLSRPRARGQVRGTSLYATPPSDSLSLWERVRVRVASLIEDIEREKAMIVREREAVYGA